MANKPERISPQEPKPLCALNPVAPACTSQDDLREYLAHLDGMNLSETQKIELLETLWPIMSAFVDLAFDTDPVQQALAQPRSDKTK